MIFLRLFYGSYKLTPIMENNFKKFPISKPLIGQKELQYVSDAINSGWVSSLGEYIERFESAFAAFCGTKYALTTSNGTTGLHLALLAAGIKAGDEVIVPDLTFVATANAVTYVGATPIFVDVNRESYCISPEAIEKAITPNTKAIIPVHLYGHPCDMDRINQLAGHHNIKVIEDAAEAHGAKYKNRPVGSLGACGVFSFYGNKIITSGEGGMITTNDPDLFQKAKVLRDHAMSYERRYWHEEVGFNYRMTNMQAAMGLAQLEQIEYFLLRRANILTAYKKYIVTDCRVRLNFSAEWADPVCWLVCAEIEGISFDSRAHLMQLLSQRGVDSRPFFYPLSDMPMYKISNSPMAHVISQSGINLPTYVGLSDSEIELICGIFKDCLKLID